MTMNDVQKQTPAAIPHRSPKYPMILRRAGGHSPGALVPAAVPIAVIPTVTVQSYGSRISKRFLP
jgi:hypothetical protein